MEAREDDTFAGVAVNKWHRTPAAIVGTMGPVVAAAFGVSAACWARTEPEQAIRIRLCAR